MSRYWSARLPSLPNVMLCDIQPGSYGWHAHTWPRRTLLLHAQLHVLTFPDNRHTPLANSQPVPQRRNQQRQRQQIHRPLNLCPSPELPDRCHSLLLRSPRPQLPRPTPEASFTKCTHDPRSSRPLRSRRIRRCPKCLPHARRRDSPRYRHLPCTD